MAAMSSPSPISRRVLAAVAFATAIVLASAGVAAATTTPGPDAPLAARAKAAKVPLMSGEAFATHTHTQLRLIVDGKAMEIPALIGIDEAAHQITALHTHDNSGIIHVESPKVSDHYRLDQFLVLWGAGKSKPQLCTSLAGATDCTIKVSSTKYGTKHGLATRLDDQDNILVTVTTKK